MPCELNRVTRFASHTHDTSKRNTIPLNSFGASTSNSITSGAASTGPSGPTVEADDDENEYADVSSESHAAGSAADASGAAQPAGEKKKKRKEVPTRGKNKCTCRGIRAFA